MKLDKADMPKIIVLGALVAIFIGYGVYSVVGKHASADPAPPVLRDAAAPHPPAAVKPQAATDVVANETPQPSLQVASEPVKKDPFVPCIVAEAAQCTPRLRSIMPRGKLPNLPPYTPSFGIRVRPSGSAPLSPLVSEPDPAFVLTGIVNGATNVAIIRAGETGRHIVTVGQLIDGKYLVKFIGRDRVVLRHGTRSIDLRLGGGTNAS
jgi:hypothetical protein